MCYPRNVVFPKYPTGKVEITQAICSQLKGFHIDTGIRLVGISHLFYEAIFTDHIVFIDDRVHDHLRNTPTCSSTLFL
jgi:hypothetical protein